MESTESALEQFRAQWREEVSKKSKSKGRQKNRKDDQTSADLEGTAKPQKKSTAPPVAASQTEIPERHDRASKPIVDDDAAADGDDDAEIDVTVGSIARNPQVKADEAQPKSALAYYEAAVEREAAGTLGDSVNLYRQAYKLDDGVHEAYKKKHFPSSAPPPKPASKNRPAVSSTSVNPTAKPPPSVSATSDNSPKAPPNTITDLIATFANLSIPAAEPPTSLSPPLPYPISDLPSELLSLILTHCATLDPQTLPHLALTCRALAYATHHNPLLYRHILFSTPHGMPAQRYRYACTVSGSPLSDPYLSSMSCRLRDLTPATYPTYRTQYRHRPRVRFGGAYISTVNYSRPGGHSLTINADGTTAAGSTGSTVSKHTWSAQSPVHIVTYYRYLRFYRDGTCVSLLTSAEPTEVIAVLSQENVPVQGGKGGKEAAGSGIMKEALLGRWRISGPSSGPAPLLDVEPRLGECGERGRREDWSEGLSKRVGEYAKEPRFAAADSRASHPHGPTRSDTTARCGTAASAGVKSDDVAGEGEEEDEEEDEEEEEGTLHIETQGVVPRYLWKMQFQISSSRKDAPHPPAPSHPSSSCSSKPSAANALAPNGTTRNNRLAWRGFWSYNKLTDDWGEFGLKNDRDRGFVWSRVRGWGVGGW